MRRAHVAVRRARSFRETTKPMSARRRRENLAQLSRRSFLKASAAAGLVLSATPWMSGCGDGSDDDGGGPTSDAGRELVDLHFNLSNQDPDAVYVLRAI